MSAVRPQRTGGGGGALEAPPGSSRAPDQPGNTGRTLDQPGDVGRALDQPGGGGRSRALEPPSGAARVLDAAGGGGGRALEQPGCANARALDPLQSGVRSADPSSTDKRSEMSADDTNSSLHDIQQVEDDMKKFVSSGNGTRYWLTKNWEKKIHMPVISYWILLYTV